MALSIVLTESRGVAVAFSCMHATGYSRVYGSVKRPSEWTMPVSQQA